MEREIVDTGIARTALSAFSRSAFIDSSSARQSFDRKILRLLLGLDAPVLFVKMLGEDALAGAPDPAHPGLDQIQISTQDEQCLRRSLMTTLKRVISTTSALPVAAPPTGNWRAGWTATA